TTYREFMAWISTIARHQLENARQRVRAQKRGGGRARIVYPQGDESNALAAGLVELLARDSRSPRSLIGDREFHQLVRDALAKLDPDDQQIVRLRYLEQMRHVEIAGRVGRSEDAVKMICFRAIKRLRRLLPVSSIP